MISIGFEAFVTDFHAFSMPLYIFDRFLEKTPKGPLNPQLKGPDFEPRPARLKQRPHHLKRFRQAPTSDLNRF